MSSPGAEDFERLEELLATVDPPPKRGEPTWLFADDVASIARVLAAAREAERLRGYLECGEQRERWYAERVAALEAVLREVRWADPDRIAAALAAGK